MRISSTGKLTAEGIAFVKQAFPELAGDPDRIQRLFEPEGSGALSRSESRLSNRMRERVIEEDAKGAATRVEIRRGRLVPSNGATGLYATRDVILFTSRSLGTIWDCLQRISRIALPHAAFLHDDGSDLRQWTVVRFFAELLRIRREPHFTSAYRRVHEFYLGDVLTDPLQMLLPQELESGRLTMHRMTFKQFLGIGDRRLTPTQAAEYSQGLPTLTPHVRAMAPNWFRALFQGLGFGAQLLGALSSPLQAALESSGSPCDGEMAGAALLRAKQPDIVQIWPERRSVFVLDATNRPKDPWHNFKTCLYVAALRQALQGSGASWDVTGLDFHSWRLQTPLFRTC